MNTFKPKKVAEPQPRPDVEVDDHLYVHHQGQPCTGRVRAHGKHGVTLEIEGKHHKVTWDKVLGHKQRAAQRYEVVDHGEDGMLVEDARGRRRFVAVPNESKEDPMVAKTMGSRPVLLFMKADDPVVNRPGLSKKQITDKRGVQTTKWVKTNKDQPTERKPAAQGAADAPAHGLHNTKSGDGVKFKAGDFEGTGKVVGQPGNDGAHVEDASGRVHQVHWHEITDKGDDLGKPADAAPASEKPATDGPLFSEQDIAALPAKVNQPAASWEELQTKGAEGLEQFKEQLGTVAKSMGLQSGRKPETLSPEDWVSDQGFLFVGSLKSEARAAEKVEADYGGDWSQLRDMVRATISVPDMAGVKEALGHLKAAGIDLAQKPKDRFAKPTNAGYRDLMTIVKLPNGMLAELQLHVKGMTLAKTEGHKPYEAMRGVQAKYPGEEEPTDKWSDEDHATYYKALKEQQEIYGKAWQKASGKGDAAAPQAPLQKSMSSSKMIILFRGLS